MRKFNYKSLNSLSSNIHLIFDATSDDESKHIHDFIEIIYIASGEIIETINGKDYLMGRGDLLILNTKSVHSFKRKTPSSYYNLCFFEESMDKLLRGGNVYSPSTLTKFVELQNLNDVSIFNFDGEDRREIESALHAMYLAQQTKNPSYEVIEQSYLNILFTKILTEVNKTVSKNSDELEKIKDYILNNLDSDLSLKTIAKKFYYNNSYLSRAFKKRFGISYISFVQAKRIEHAIFLIQNTNEPIDIICESVGYSSKNAFYKEFKKITGKTPVSYRK